MKYQAMIELQFTGPLDDLDEYTDRLTEALYDLHDVVDPDLGGSLASGRLDITMVVDAESLEEATHKSLGAARAAIHAAGGSTAGWDRMIREVGTQARELVDA